MSRRCLICSNLNPCREHSDADQSNELARNDAAIAKIRAERELPPLPPGRNVKRLEKVTMTSKGPVITDVRVIDTSELGPIKIEPPTYRQQQAKIVREALEVAAAVESDDMIATMMLNVARTAHTETLAYLARLLKG